MFGNKWTSEYYDVMEFYYWEPQHLGKIKNPKSRYNNQFKSLEHIRNMEVSLNHMFNVFFRLTPSKFVSDLLSTTCNVVADSKLSMQGRYDVRKFSKMVQPDLLFVSDNINFSIEMKIGAKSSLEQVYKYALLHWLEQQHSGRKRQSVLLYIGKLQIRAKKVEDIDINWDEVQDILSNTIIDYCSYSDFNRLLNGYSDESSSETEVKLFDGLSFELEKRGLS